MTDDAVSTPRSAQFRESPDRLDVMAADLASMGQNVLRLAIAAERASNIAEEASEQCVKVLSATSQTDTQLRLVQMSQDQIKLAIGSMSQQMTGIKIANDEMKSEIEKLKEGLFVALGRGKQAEELALEAKAKATHAAHAIEVTQRRVDVVAKEVEQLDDRVDGSANKHETFLTRRLEKSETDLQDQAKAAAEIVRAREEREHAKELAEIELRRAHEEREHAAKLAEIAIKREELANKREESRQRWETVKRVLGPTGIVMAFIALVLAIVGKL